MRLIAFIMEPPVVEKMELLHNPAKAMTLAYRRPTEPPAVLPARAPPQMDLDFDQVTQFDQGNDLPDMDQSSEGPGETLN